MLKTILYLTLGIGAIVASFFSPLAGAIGCVEAYLFNPNALLIDNFGFRYQLWTSIAFLAGVCIQRPKPLAKVGQEAAILWFAWGFVFMCVLSSAWARVSSTAALDFGYDMAKTVLFSSVLVIAITSERSLSIFISACIVGVLHAAALHTFGLRLGFISSGHDREEGVLIEGQSQVMVAFLPLLIVLLIWGNRRERLLAFCTLPLAMNSIVKTYERRAFVAICVEIVIFLLFLPRRNLFRALLVLVAAGSLFVVKLTPKDYWTKMDTIQDPMSEASAASRFVLAETSWHMFLDHPMGVGYKNYKYVSPEYLDPGFLTEGTRAAHNSFFAVLCDLGVFGFMVWMMAIGTALVKLRQVGRAAGRANSSRRLAAYAMGVEIGLYGWLVTGLFGDQSGLDPPYWFLALAVVLVRLSHVETGDDRSLLHEPLCEAT